MSTIEQCPQGLKQFAFSFRQLPTRGYPPRLGGLNPFLGGSNSGTSADTDDKPDTAHVNVGFRLARSL